jgi:hypothetical protein
MHTPKSNKIKRQEKGKKERLRRERQQKLANSFAARREKEEARIEKAKAVLSASKAGTRNPKEALKALYNGEKVYVPSSSPLASYQVMFQNARSNGEREALFRLLSHCVDQGAYLVDSRRMQGGRSFSNALRGLAFFHDFWVRPLEDWEPPSYNIHKQFSSLARHLFAKYPIPLFMDDAWYSGNATHQEWFLHVGEGQNIRTAKGLPLPLTKKAAHFMMQAPSDFDISGAIRWGQIHFMGGDERLVRAILKTRINNVFTNNEFWESVFRWFMANPMLDTAQYAPIIDYIYHQKFVPSVPNELPDGPRLLPAQPNLSMKNRSVDATIKAMEEWHKQTGRARKGGDKYWEGSGISEFHYEEGEHNKKVYTVSELLTAKELQEEGAAMCHCVGSYAHSCSTGRTSVWSIKQVNPDGSVNRLLTVEVDNASRSIRQARGKFNERPGFKANDIMNRWATAAGLTISRWLI